MKSEEIHLTFSQRESKVPLPEPMRLEHLSKPFRNLLWLSVDTAIQSSYPHGTCGYDETYNESPFGFFVKRYIFHIRQLPHDEVDHSVELHCKLFRDTILNGDYHCVMTFI